MRTRTAALDEGLTLIEVMVAMLVFAILSTGIVAGMTTIARMTADDRARVTAQNLAAREIDRMRSLADPDKVLAATSASDRAGVDYVVDGRSFTVARDVSWVSQSGADVTCGTGPGLLYVRINVRVTWPGQLANTAPVQDDTLLAPAARLEDSTSGAIAVAVTDDASNPQPDVAVTVKANSGGSTPAKPTAKTDAAGCARFGDLPQGNYDVTLSKAGWIDGQQDATPTKTVSVTNGATTAPQFEVYAQAAGFHLTFAGGPKATGSDLRLPSALQTSFVHGDGVWSVSPTASDTTVARYPYPDGYGVVAGLLRSADATASCAAVDPRAWSPGTVAGTSLAQGVRASKYAAGGSTEDVQVPVGVALVKAPRGSTFSAVQAPSAAGTPSCGLASTYSWGFKATGDWQAIALPYGSWKLYSTGLLFTLPLQASQIQVQTNVAAWPIGADGVVVLDPRAKG